MVKYFLGQSVLRSFWDQVFTAFWQRYPNPYGKDVSTEDSAISEQKLLSRQLLTKTNRMPCWAERLFPANVAHSEYILEDSIVAPQNQTMTTFTWNINHARLMVVEERCVYRANSDNSGRTKIRQEAWVSRAVQEFGLVQFKSNVTKTMKGFEYTLAKLQGEVPPKTLVETAKEAKEKATETALAAGKAANKQQQQFMRPAQAPDSSLADYRLQSLWPSSCTSLLKASFQPCRLSGWWAGGRCAAWHLQHSRLVTHV
ncbi:PRELI domain-containing protein 1, mitochondrial-like [Cervus elaphus]|uniref:PRELI domain-containing protein 1, mitochondrial-like n=1 Tax=Cervus elaphus TaxID=9860 RepID=UPI001CC2CFD5|nr:PRELI domain-containing protein 1, mitochondrial-like [Cervus elaphus]